MLALKVEYLTGVCMATRHDDPSRSTPEWPPHPDRLYSALVAAAAEPKTDDDIEAQAYIPEAAKSALQWLAEQGAPQLAASEARRRSSPDIHVPSNPHEDEVWQKPKKGKARAPKNDFDLKTLLPVHRRKAALPIPSVVPDEPVAYFIWPNAKPSEHLDALRAICGRVTYLGRSRSLVSVTLADNPPPATYVLDPLGQVQLRVPGRNRLQELIDNFKLKIGNTHKGGKPAPCPPSRYGRVDEALRQQQPLASIFDRMFIFKPHPGAPSLPAECTLMAAQALRRALLKRLHQRVCNCERWKQGVPRCEDAPDCYAQIPTLISGYERNGSPTKEPHVAFVGLPFAHPRQRHADGTIKGLAILVPRDPPVRALQALAMALVPPEKHDQQVALEIPGIGTWLLEEVEADNPPLFTLDARSWTSPSQVWSTVTPMAFGHFPKDKKGGEGKVILDSLRMIGVDLPNYVVQIAVGRHSPIHGAPPSWCFHAQRGRRSDRQPPRLFRHVTFRFSQAVRGPIILGCMRHFGLGLMQPLEESPWQS